MFALTAFKAFLRTYGWLLATCALFAGASGAIVDFVTGFGPPWPNRIAARALLTAIVGVVTCMLVFWKYWRAPTSKKTRGHGLIVAIICLVVFGAAYLVVLALMTFEDDKRVRHAKGFVLTGDMWEARYGKSDIRPFPGVPNLTDRITRNTSEADILKKVGYDADMVWETWSISIINLALLLMWLVAFGSLSWTFGVFIAGEEKLERSV